LVEASRRPGAKTSCIMFKGKGWGGKGCGKGKGWGVRQPRDASGEKTSNVVPDDFAIDENQVFTGVCTMYYKLNGYGFITLDEKGIVPSDKVFAFWSAINSSDRFPSLQQEQKLQFTIKKEKNKHGATQLKADGISLLGGEPVALQDEVDAKKTFVGGSSAARFTGSLKFFHTKNGFGYVTVDEGQTFDIEGVQKEIRVETAEVNAGGGQPGHLRELPVEFGIWQTKKGQFKAHNMTAPGGGALPTKEESPLPTAAAA